MSTQTTLPLASSPLALEYTAPGPMTQFRWVILGLVFFGTTVNYMDRLVLSILAPDLKDRFHISDPGYGNIQAAFALSYALGQLVSGRWLDWIGTRVGYAVALTAWSF